MVNLCYVTKFKPFKDRMVWLTELVNEVSCLLLIYHTMYFTDYMVDEVDRYKIGWSFIAFFTLSFLAHLALLIHAIIVAIRKAQLKQKILKHRAASGQAKSEN